VRACAEQVKDCTYTWVVLGSDEARRESAGHILRRCYPEAFAESAAPSSKPSEVLGWLGTENGYTQDTRSATPVERKAERLNPNRAEDDA
jgi:hypothetical protein